MLFNSISFLVFFPIVLIFYFLAPFKYRWMTLLVASYYFYMSWNPLYIILILFSTGVSYCSALMMDKAKSKNRRKTLLIISVILNLGVLFLFKYFNFLNDSMQYVFSKMGFDYSLNRFSLLLPMGISFYTFQTLSYTIDVYRGGTPAEKHFGYYALFISFFPQLVAGPIERSENLLPQFYKKYDFEYTRVTNGFKLMAWGFFKKVVIADTLAVAVNRIYNNPSEFTGLALIIATIFFAFQIFCDFSGYSDIAIGSAEVMGFKLMDNFKRPYYSKSIAEFWRRWHISLSTWFKDYVYIPMGGNRRSKWRTFLNLMITFVLSGLWHGANWTFAIWGAIHGFFQIFGKLTKPYRDVVAAKIGLERVPRLHKFMQVAVTFCLVCFGWIFFRANSVNDAFYIVANLFSGVSEWFNLSYIAGVFSGLFATDSLVHFAVILFSLSIMEIIHLIQRKIGIRTFLSTRKTYVRWLVYALLLAFIIMFMNTESHEFIYFQF